MTTEDGTIIYRVEVLRNGKNILVGSTGLKTIEAIHKGEIESINHEFKIVYLKTSSPYGK